MKEDIKMIGSIYAPLEKPRKYLILLVLSTLIIGGLSLGRLNPVYENLGFLGEVRYWLFYILALLMAVTMLHRSRTLIPSSVKKCMFLSIVLHGYIILSFWWAPDRAVATSKIPDIFLLIGILFLAPFIFSYAPQKSSQYLLKTFWIVALIFTIGGITNYWTDDGGLKAFWAGSIGSARIWATGILCAIYLWVKNKKYYFLFPIPLLLAGVIFSTNRGAFLALAIASFLFLLSIRKMLKINKILFSLILLLPILFLLYSIPSVQERLPLFLFSLVGGYDFKQLGFENLYWGDRDILFFFAWVIFTENPLTGGGLGSFDFLTGELYPHNLILNIASDGGLVGLFLFLLVVILFFRRWFLPKNLEQMTAFCLGIFYFICSMLAGTYYDARFMWLFFLLYLMPATVEETKDKTGNSSEPERLN